jgi:acyl-coenzyme A thioesterase 13
MAGELPRGFVTDAAFDPAEDYIGPFYYKQDGDSFRYAFRADDRHCNAFQVVHGGVLMVFADYALCMEATNHYDNESCVTVSFNCDFVSAGSIGDLIESSAEVIRKTGSMVFVRGTVFVGGETILRYSGVVKRYRDSHQT